MKPIVARMKIQISLKATNMAPFSHSYTYLIYFMINSQRVKYIKYINYFN